ncbi:hypothetical protein, partial [Staphylococcus aureus]|uniref:hypothetical protein n=1 Tax=Staphylococcus aureus TaxID=1280 RepID=UPI0037DA499C
MPNPIPTPLFTPHTLTQPLTTINQPKHALNRHQKLPQPKQQPLPNLHTLPHLNQPQPHPLTNQINQTQALPTVQQTKQNSQNLNTAM